MDFTTVGTVTAIVAICYLIGLAVKAIPNIKDELIPVIVGACGGALGVAGLYLIPEFPASDILNAIAIGIASGLASTGANQIYKQLTKNEDLEGKDEI